MRVDCYVRRWRAHLRMQNPVRHMTYGTRHSGYSQQFDYLSP